MKSILFVQEWSLQILKAYHNTLYIMTSGITMKKLLNIMFIFYFKVKYFEIVIFFKFW